jgi:hypothetical protein
MDEGSHILPAQTVPPPPDGRPSADKRRFGLARLAWVILFVLTTVAFLAQLWAIWHAQPIASWESAAISSRAYLVYRVVLDASLFLSYAIVGIIIFWRTEKTWFSLVITLAPILLILRITPSYASQFLIQPAFAWLTTFLEYLGAFLLGLALALFPNGRFVPRWMTLYSLFVAAYAFELFYLDGRIRLQLGSELVQLLLDAALVAIGVAAQVFRYRRVSTPEERQQTRWVLFGVAIGFTGIYAYFILLYLFPELESFSGSGLYYQIAGQSLSFLALLAIPVTFAIAIMRYRLWDIDLVIRRTLVYSALTGLLALIYFATVVILQALFGASLFSNVAGGEQSSAAVVLSTLLIAALFTPLRRGLQNVIDRRFYRRKYDAAEALARFAAVTRSEVDPDRLAAELVKVIEETMQPASVTLWLVKK